MSVIYYYLALVISFIYIAWMLVFFGEAFGILGSFIALMVFPIALPAMIFITSSLSAKALLFHLVMIAIWWVSVKKFYAEE